MGNPLTEMVDGVMGRREGNAIPLPKYTLAVMITGNTREEVASAVRQLDTDFAIDWRDRDQIDSTDGRTSVWLEVTDANQTPEKYAQQLSAWREEERSRKAVSS